uniref:Uncharacterized protein n=1 Tax=Leptobrachium leishanense TaxID=445787 RepID=A0A8C5QNW0_9ANUR
MSECVCVGIWTENIRLKYFLFGFLVTETLKMANLFDDYKLRPVHLLLPTLLTILVILWYCYQNETSQSIELQQKILFLQRRLQSMSVERSTLRQKATLLKDQLENQTNEMNKHQKIHDYQIAQQNINFVSERVMLEDTITSKDNSLQQLEDQHEALKKQYEALRSEMQQFEKNQALLLEKFSTQSAQCINIISMMKQLCFEKEGKLSRRESNSTTKKETTFINLTMTFPPSVNQTMKPTSNHTDNTTRNLEVKLTVATNTSMSEKSEADTGGFFTTSTISPLETTAQMFTSRATSNNQNSNGIRKEVQSFVRGNEKAKEMGKTIVEELRKQLLRNNISESVPMQEKSIKSGKDDLLKEENEDVPEVDDDPELTGGKEKYENAENELLPIKKKENTQTILNKEIVGVEEKKDEKGIVSEEIPGLEDDLEDDNKLDDQEDEMKADKVLEKINGIDKQKAVEKKSADTIQKYDEERSTNQNTNNKTSLYNPATKLIYNKTKPTLSSEISPIAELKSREEKGNQRTNDSAALLIQNVDLNIRQKQNLVTGNLVFENEKKKDTKKLLENRNERTGATNVEQQIKKGASDKEENKASSESKKKLPDVL